MKISDVPDQQFRVRPNPDPDFFFQIRIWPDLDPDSFFKLGPRYFFQIKIRSDLDIRKNVLLDPDVKYC